MNTDNRFEQREDEGRIKWLLLNLNDILRGNKCVLFTRNPYAVFDFEMTAYTTNILSYGEIKTVHRNYTNYSNFQIDYNKLKSLKDACKSENRTPYLVVFFTDYTMVWDLTDIDLEERKYTCNCTSTTAENYTKGKREKVEVWLDDNQGLIYKRANPTNN